MVIENQETKLEAIRKIRELTQKIDGKDPRIEQAEKDLNELETELQAAIERYKEPIAVLKEQIKTLNLENRKFKNEFQKEVNSLKDALVEFELANNAT